MSYCYLIHFSIPIGNRDNKRASAQHYLGYTSKGIKARLAEHQSKMGAKITRAAVEQGAELIVVKTWSNGTRRLERSLKQRHNSKHLCPICSPLKRYPCIEKKR